jgi:hypothetical protein
MHRRALIVVVSFALVALAVVAWPRSGTPVSPPRGERASEAPGEGAEVVRGGSSEVEEEQHETAERIEALNQAIADGRFGQAVSATTAPAAGWVGSQVLDSATDDWEPAVAADPNDPYVYMITTRYGEPKPCKGHCPSPWIGLTISSDGGDTWSDVEPLCTCTGSGAQYDPTIEVVPNTGAVVAVFLNADRAGGFSSVYMSSSDHGETWTDPVHVYGKVAWTDKPEVTTSPGGRDVYVSWNGPQGGDPWIGQSHDFGETWTQTKLVTSKRYFFAWDADVLPDRSIIFSESSLTYTAPGQGAEGKVWHHAFISSDLGETWENVIVDKVQLGEPCVSDGCYDDFYDGQSSVSSDEDGDLAFTYTGASVDQGPRTVYARTSEDGGFTWSKRTALSVDGENATGPRVEATGSGDFRLWYMQTKNEDVSSWNVWYRSSTNGGDTWKAPVKISDAPADAAGYTDADGFDEIYGDYGEIDITSEGKTIAVWGEGFSWLGPGGTWFNLQD